MTNSHFFFQADVSMLPASVNSSKNGQLQFQNISVSDAGTYVCSANNSAGTVEERAVVIVNGTYQYTNKCI